jgi:hypothetical protein
MTLGEALTHARGMRGNLSDAEYKAWSKRLEDFTPEVVAKAADAVADSWDKSGTWPFSMLMHKCRELEPNAIQAAPREDRPVFWWGVDGRFGGDPKVLRKCSAEDRTAMAAQVRTWHGKDQGPSLEQDQLADVLAGDA